MNMMIGALRGYVGHSTPALLRRVCLRQAICHYNICHSNICHNNICHNNICHNNICHNNICTSINMTSKVWLTFDQKQIWPEWSLPSVENSWHLSPTKGSDKSSRPHDGHDREGYRRGNLPIIVSSKQQDVTPPDSLVLLGWENCFVGFSDQRE